jgi:hypothetical protein
MVLDHHLVPEVITPALCVAVAGRLADVENEGPGDSEGETCSKIETNHGIGRRRGRRVMKVAWRLELSHSV